MRRLIRNKKAVVEALFDIAIALLVLFLGIVAMTSLSKIDENRKIIAGDTFIGHAISENNLALYLKQPVTINVDNKDLTMAELIVLAYEYRGDYEDEWKEKTYDFFYGVEKKVEITIEQQGGRTLSHTVSSEGYQEKEKLLGQNLLYNLFFPNRGHYSVTSTMYLPSYNAPLEIEFKRWVKKDEEAKTFMDS